MGNAAKKVKSWFVRANGRGPSVLIAARLNYRKSSRFLPPIQRLPLVALVPPVAWARAAEAVAVAVAAAADTSTKGLGNGVIE